MSNMYNSPVGGSYIEDFLNKVAAPKIFPLDDSAAEVKFRPKILLMGLQRSGKSSIHQVVFHKMAPNETLFLESTTKLFRDDISQESFIQFQIWDCPGQLDFSDESSDSLDAAALFEGCSAIIFVVDAQEDFGPSLEKLRKLLVLAREKNERIKFEVFVHKMDGLVGDDEKTARFKTIYHRVESDLSQEGIDMETQVSIAFHLTSIYDHTIFEAFSKVVQKLIPQVGPLAYLLDSFNRKCRVAKSFIFDVNSKIYIATDSTPVDMHSYEMCCSMIDLSLDISWIYGSLSKGGMDTLPFDKGSESVVLLGNGLTLYMKYVNAFLALVSLFPDNTFESNRSLVDYNVEKLRDSINRVFQVDYADGAFQD